MSILVSGCCDFIGKNLVYGCYFSYPEYHFIRKGICDGTFVEKVFLEVHPDIIFNFTAEMKKRLECIRRMRAGGGH